MPQTPRHLGDRKAEANGQTGHFPELEIGRRGLDPVCSRRVESRAPDIAGHALPTWQEVIERDYHAWDRDRLVVDTAASDVTATVRAIVGRLPAQA